MTVIPPRIGAAVALLAPRKHEQLLEIGCGTGQAIAAVLAAEPTVRCDAIDRSPRAVARARAVNADAIAAGRASVALGDIEVAPPQGRFDRIFAIRVNSFWTRPGLALPHVAGALTRGGELWAIWDAPEPKISGPMLASLRNSGWRSCELAGAGAWAIAARPPG